MKTAVISDLYQGTELPDAEGAWRTFVPHVAVPTLDALAPFDLVILFAKIDEADGATELSGVFDHLLLRGKTVVLLYYVRLDGNPGIVADRLVRHSYGHQDRGSPLSGRAPAWDAFFRSYGTAATYFVTDDAADDERTLAVFSAGQYADYAAALALPVNSGTLYVIPFHVADITQSQLRLLRDLIEAITADRSEGLAPDYLGALRLPGEQDMLDAIKRLEGDLADQRAAAQRLYRYRLLLGPLSGDALEELVRDALGTVLAATEYTVEDRPETFNEDFWLVGPDGDFALAEVKGINSGVSRREVNQVDNHREELGHDTAAIPGLLVINVHRKASDLERKVGEMIHPLIIAALGRQNVTLLRSADLYNLIALEMRDGSGGRTLIDALTRGGGWLEVTDDRSELHRG